MKPKYLETQIRRQPVLAAPEDAQSVNCLANPAAAGAARTEDAMPAPVITVTQGKILVLVSEDRNLVERLESLTVSAGLDFMQVNDPSEALYPSGGNRPVLIFLDLDLPALAGWKAAEEFVQNTSVPSLILLTGRASNLDLSAAIRTGIIVDKSVSTAGLLEKVGLILMESESERLDRKARQQVLLRWLMPYDWPATGESPGRFRAGVRRII